MTLFKFYSIAMSHTLGRLIESFLTHADSESPAGPAGSTGALYM